MIINSELLEALEFIEANKSNIDFSELEGLTWHETINFREMDKFICRVCSKEGFEGWRANCHRICAEQEVLRIYKEKKE